MSIAKLLKVLPAPKKPIASVDWSKLPFEVPDDYKQFMEHYGPGNLADYVHIWSPFGRNESDLVVNAKRSADGLRSISAPVHRYAFYPDKGGLLPFGRTDNSDILTWLPKGASSKWRVVVTDGIDAYPTKKTFTEFLTGIVTASFKAPGVAEGAHGNPTFYAYVPPRRSRLKKPRRSRSKKR
jgi:hypothetical protein